MKLNVATTIAIIFILSLWSLWLVPSLADYGNITLVFILFTAVYVYISMWLLGTAPHETKNGFKTYIGWLLIFLVFDIIALPFILDRDIFTEPINSSKLASDYIIYSLLPDIIPHQIKYWATYTLIPAFLIVIVYLLLGRNNFEKVVRENV